MNLWIEQSGELITSVASFLLSEPVFYIVGLFFLVIACRLFKSVGGW